MRFNAFDAKAAAETREDTERTLGYRLREGERIMIRRALTMYAQHFNDTLRAHKQAGDAYNAEYDQARLDAIDALSEKILKGGVK